MLNKNIKTCEVIFEGPENTFSDIDYSLEYKKRWSKFFGWFLPLGFNSTETKIQAPDGKVWKEEEFQHLSIKIYKDLSKQFAGEQISKTFSHKQILFVPFVLCDQGIFMHIVCMF